MSGIGASLLFTLDFPASEIRNEFLNELKNTVTPALESAMNDVLAESKSILASHVQKDVYDKWTPSTYQRSGELKDIESTTRGSYADAQTMRLEYEPSGESEQWQNPLNDNDLIRRIESGSGYEWYPHPGARPFWRNFVNEMIESGFASAFDNAMFFKFGSDYEGATSVERESVDGDY